jgi:hypothetical protein
MKSLATHSPARSAQAPAMSKGLARLLSLGESYGCVNSVQQRLAAPCRCGVRQSGGGLWWGEIGGVDSDAPIVVNGPVSSPGAAQVTGSATPASGVCDRCTTACGRP